MSYTRWVYPEGSSAIVCYNYNPDTRVLYVIYKSSSPQVFAYADFTHLSAARLISADSCGAMMAKLLKGKIGLPTSTSDLPSIPDIQ